MSPDKGSAPLGPRSARMLPLTSEQVTQFSNWAASPKESSIFRHLSPATQSSAPAHHSSQSWRCRVPVCITHHLANGSSSSANPAPPRLCSIRELRAIASPTSRRQRFEVLISPSGKPIFGAFVVNPDVTESEPHLRQLFEFSKTGAEDGEFIPIPTEGELIPRKAYKIFFETLKFGGSIDSLPPVLSWATTTPIASSCGSSEVGATPRVRGRPQRQLKRAAPVTSAVGDEGRDPEGGHVHQRKRKKVIKSHPTADLPERCHPCFPCKKCLNFWGKGLPVRHFKDELKDFIRSPEEEHTLAVLPEEDNEEVKERKRHSRKGPKSRSSEYRGVSHYDRTGRWEAHIWHNGAQSFLGASLTVEEAARSYDRAALVLHFADADLNFKPLDYEVEFPFLSSLTKYQLEVYLRREAVGYGEEAKYPGVVAARNAKRGYQAFYKPSKKRESKEVLGFFGTEEEAVRSVFQNAKRRKNFELAGRIMEVHHVRTVKPARCGIRVKKPRGQAARIRASLQVDSGTPLQGARRQSTNRITAHAATETNSAPAAKRKMNRNFRKSGHPNPLKNLLPANLPVNSLEELDVEGHTMHQEEDSTVNSSDLTLSSPASHTSGDPACRVIPAYWQPTGLGLPQATIRCLLPTPSARADHDIETIQAWGALFMMSRSDPVYASIFQPFNDGGAPTQLPVAAPQLPDAYFSAPPHSTSTGNDSVQPGSQDGSFAVAHVSEADTSSASNLRSVARSEVIPDVMASPGFRPFARGRNGPASEGLPPESPASVNINVLGPSANLYCPIPRRLVSRSSSGASTSGDAPGLRPDFYDLS